MFGSFAILVAGGVVAPGAPTIGTATATSTTTATVSFTQPAFNGGAPITSYTATSSPGNITGTVTQSGSGTITVSGLTTGTAYTFTVTATNVAGTSVASSASNSITTPTVPVNTVAPSVTGTATNGQTLSCSTGTWIGTATITFAYQWRRAGSNISGATSSTYALVDADVGSVMSCIVTGTNSQGSGTGTSNNTNAVAGLAPGIPTSVSASASGATTALVYFSAPTSNGGSTITSYTATSSPGGFTGTGSGSGITVSGLTAHTSYTFTVTATNSVGTSSASSASSSITTLYASGSAYITSTSYWTAPAGISSISATVQGGSGVSDGPRNYTATYDVVYYNVPLAQTGLQPYGQQPSPSWAYDAITTDSGLGRAAVAARVGTTWNQNYILNESIWVTSDNYWGGSGGGEDNFGTAGVYVWSVGDLSSYGNPSGTVNHSAGYSFPYSMTGPGAAGTASSAFGNTYSGGAYSGGVGYGGNGGTDSVTVTPGQQYYIQVGDSGGYVYITWNAQ